MRCEVMAELATPDAKQSRNRRLTDKIFVAFHQACDQADFDVAAELLCVLELMARRPTPKHESRRHDREWLVAAHERLWHLRHSAVDPNDLPRAAALLFSHGPA
jgi:hypothetical protein